jgi:hypothetical protein
MAKRAGCQIVDIDGLISTRQITKQYKISRTKLRNALVHSGYKSPKVVQTVSNTYLYDRKEFEAWAFEVDLNKTRFPDSNGNRPYVRKCERNDESSYFNFMAKQFITRGYNGN